MRPIVTDRVAWSVGLSACYSPAKTVEPIEVPFGLRTRVGKGSMHFVGVHLANITELSMCGGDAACCQITLTTCNYFRPYENEGRKL